MKESRTQSKIKGSDEQSNKTASILAYSGGGCLLVDCSHQKLKKWG